MQAKRPKGQIDREAFLALCDLSVPAFYSLRRRDQFPLRPPPELGIDWDLTIGWSPMAALAFIVSTALVDRYALSRDRAAQIAGKILRAAPGTPAGEKWPAIVAGATEIIEGKANPPPHILLASLEVPGIQPTKKVPDPTIEIGTLDEIAERWPTASAIIGVSLTRCVADIRKRAARHKIDLGGFWENG